MSALRQASRELALKNTAVVIANTSYITVAEKFDLRGAASRVRVEIYLSAASGSGTLTFQLRSGSMIVSDTYVYEPTGKSKTLDTSTVTPPVLTTVTLQAEVAGDQAYLPTGLYGILEVKSDGTATCTIAAVKVIQEGL